MSTSPSSAVRSERWHARPLRLLVMLLAGTSALAHETATSQMQLGRLIRFTEGTFHGPGNMADTPSPGGELTQLAISAQLEGSIDLFNNGAAPPNVASETAAQGSADGRLSSGRPFNEHMDGGVIPVGRGAMSFLNVTVADGPGGGRARTFLDRDFNFHLVVDLALDPGFVEGLIVIDQLDITSGIVQVPASLQTLARQQGGIDRAGSLATGAAVVGRAGDFDGDGRLDGVMVGVTNIPLTHILLPGAPAVQVRAFTSDVAIAPLDAALLATVSALNLASVLADARLQAHASAASRALQWLELGVRAAAAAQRLVSEPRAQRVRTVLEAVEARVAACRSSATASACEREAANLRDALRKASVRLRPLASLRPAPARPVHAAGAADGGVE